VIGSGLGLAVTCGSERLQSRRSARALREVSAVLLYLHPVSSNCHKVLMAFYERGVPFETEIVDMFDVEQNTAYRREINPIGKIPALRTDEGDVLPESTLIIEYAEQRFPDLPRLIPEDPHGALEARRWDRFVDLYLNATFSKILQDNLRPEGTQDSFGVAEARRRLGRSYAILDAHLADRQWLAGNAFTMADCAAAPSLHLGQRALSHEGFPNLQAYYERVCGRPTWQRVWNDNLPWREKVGVDLKAMRAAMGWDEATLAEDAESAPA